VPAIQPLAGSDAIASPTVPEEASPIFRALDFTLLHDLEKQAFFLSPSTLLAIGCDRDQHPAPARPSGPHKAGREHRLDARGPSAVHKRAAK
jgi:hypothetical protein